MKATCPVKIFDICSRQS